MKLSKKVTIKFPSYKDENGNIVKPLDKTFDEISLTYCDSPDQKKYYLHVQELEHYGTIFLFEDTTYEGLSPITRDIAEEYLKLLMGDDPQSYLQTFLPRTLEDDPDGPGTILSGMFGALGIKSSPTCSCKRHAIEMNTRGPEWCEQNLSTILSWLREESSKRNLPFIESIASLIVKRAINKSKRLLAKKNNEQPIST